MVVVADGSELAERKIARVFWSDPALGVARYADAGVPAARALARECRHAPRNSQRSRPRIGAMQPVSRARYAMSIDTGGTFTDGFVSDGEHTVQVKVDTTPQDLTIGFEACLEAAAAAVGHELPALPRRAQPAAFQLDHRHQHDRRAPRRAGRLIVTRGAPRQICTAPHAQAGRWHRFVDLDLVRGVSEEVDAGGAWSGCTGRGRTRDSPCGSCSSAAFGCWWSASPTPTSTTANELRARELIGQLLPAPLPRARCR